MQIPLTNELNLASPSAVTTNSVYDHIINRKGKKISKTGHTLNGEGAQTDNIFTITGAVEIVALWGECTEATNATTCGTCYFDLFDGSAALEVTDNGGTDLASITVGSVISKTAAATVALTKTANDAGALIDGAAGAQTVFCPFVAMKKTGEATYLRFCFTGDVDTDIDMTFNVRYVPLTTDGAIAAA
jgi:hypothetical protein